MHSPILTPLPPELEPYREDLQYFFATMVRKLHTNRHKGVAVDIPLGDLVRGLRAELDELVEALTSKGQFEAAVEAADVANFAFLLAAASLNMTRDKFVATRGGLG